MRYAFDLSCFLVQPEVAGARVVRSRSAVLCVFDTWLGDDLLRIHPELLVTTPLRAALSELPGLTGVTTARAKARRSPFFRRYTEGRLPVFWYFRADGVPGLDDAGLTADGSLVVSRRVLDTFLEFKVRRAVFAQYSPSEPGASQPAAFVFADPQT